ncbi:MAG: hypothetical protein EP329_07795 [Deltaproteobacteria bacterium]|nr:MAG: hypothetical protein EP329_07795 [Deltaproteobacteria bacterium]
MAGHALSHSPGSAPRPPTEERPLGIRARHEVLVDFVIAVAVLAFGVAVYLGRSEVTGWSAFRVAVVIFAAFFGLGFLARAIRAFVQRRRFARLAQADRGGPGE